MTSGRLPLRPVFIDAAPRPQRRLLLKAALGTGVLFGTAAAGGAVWMRTGIGTLPLDIASALDRIDVLEKSRLTGSGTVAWTPNQVFTHCAQSIEYAMSAYPVMQPALWRDTVGVAALEAFMRKRRMMHDLSAPIDGAPAIDAAEDFRVGLMRLRQAFVNFRHYGGPLAPHFAYGVLDKEQYETLHVMHFWNHLEQIEVQA